MIISSPLLTIVTVVLNDCKNIEQTILSVISQKDASIEYILIDGGSIDGTVEVIKKYDTSIDYWVSEPDSGVYGAMNKGIIRAKGQFIGLLNSGDYYNSGVLEIIIKNVKDIETKYHVIAGGMDRINEDNKCIKKYYLTSSRLTRRYFSMPFFHPAMFVSSSVYNDYGLYNPNYKIAADYEFALRLLDNNISISIIPYIFTSMRIGGLSDVASNFFVQQKETYMIRRNYKGTIFCGFVMFREIVSFLLKQIKNLFL